MTTQEEDNSNVVKDFLGPKVTHTAIHYLVNMLIEALYIPVETDKVSVVDPSRLEHFKIEGEAINWGDLKCTQIVGMVHLDDEMSESGELKINFYQLTIEEASPDTCPTFCNYIERHMKAYGWNVQVRTQW